jgi:hypothetical protein
MWVLREITFCTMWVLREITFCTMWVLRQITFCTMWVLREIIFLSFCYCLLVSCCDNVEHSAVTMQSSSKVRFWHCPSYSVSQLDDRPTQPRGVVGRHCERREPACSLRFSFFFRSKQMWTSFQSLAFFTFLKHKPHADDNTELLWVCDSVSLSISPS